MEEPFDFVVIGAGSAGCAGAARLCETDRYRVLLLEAGGPDTDLWIHVPPGCPRLYANPNVNWMYETLPEPGPCERRLYHPAGKVMGGTSAINGMVYLRRLRRLAGAWLHRLGLARRPPVFPQGRGLRRSSQCRSRRGRPVERCGAAFARRTHRALARGSVLVASADPREPPAIHYNFLRNADDLHAIIAGLRLVRRIAAQPALSDYVAHELFPGSAGDSDTDFEAAIRAGGASNLSCRSSQ